MARAPAFQFYPGDWLRNDVSGCSLEAQGLWLRMMIVMHDAQIYGQLILNNAPMSPEFVAKKVGISPKKYVNLVKELEFAGVINRKENGVIFSGRMERDERARQQNRERQAKFREDEGSDGNGESNGGVTPPSRSGNGRVTPESQPSSVFPLRFPLLPTDLKRLIHEAVAKNSKLDARLVEVAIIHTLVNRNGSTDPINSISYFQREIKKICGEGDGLSSQTIDTLLSTRRGQAVKYINQRKTL